MTVTFLGPVLMKTHRGLINFGAGDEMDLHENLALRLQKQGRVKLADALRVGDRVRAKRVCPKHLRSPDYAPPGLITGRVVAIDHARMMVKIETLTHSDFWTPTAHVQKI